MDVPYIFHIYIYIFHIYFLAMFHIFSLVCFLIYGVKRRQVLIAKPRFYFYFFRFYTFYIFINNFMIFHQSVNFKPRLRYKASGDGEEENIIFSGSIFLLGQLLNRTCFGIQKLVVNLLIKIVAMAPLKKLQLNSQIVT